MCGEQEETIRHIVTECKTSTLKEYKGWRHNQVGKYVHWRLYQKFGFDCSWNWYDHEPKPVEELEECKLLWGFPIQTGHTIEHNRPDIVVVDRKERSCPFDHWVSLKEQEKIEKYQDLKREPCLYR